MIDEKTFFTLTAGVYILGCRQKGKNYGCIIDTVMQISFTPPLICISCEKKAYTQQIIRETGRFSISVLPQDTPKNVIEVFGYQSSKNTDKWAIIPFDLQEDLPIYSRAISTLTAQVIHTQEFDTHFLFIAEIKEARSGQEAIPLTYQYYRGHLLKAGGSNEKHPQGKWICDVCGYVYNESTPFEQLGTDYHCPICGVSKDYFSLKKC